jgi:hypothetical protein
VASEVDDCAAADGVACGRMTEPTGAVDALPGSTAGCAFIPQTVQ